MKISMPQPDYPQSYNLIREALVREIREAKRWLTVINAWEALGHVRLLARGMQEERELPSPSEQRGCFSKETPK